MPTHIDLQHAEARAAKGSRNGPLWKKGSHVRDSPLSPLALSLSQRRALQLAEGQASIILGLHGVHGLHGLYGLPVFSFLPGSPGFSFATSSPGLPRRWPRVRRWPPAAAPSQSRRSPASTRPPRPQQRSTRPGISWLHFWVEHGGGASQGMNRTKVRNSITVRHAPGRTKARE